MKLSTPVMRTLLMSASLGMVVPILAQTTPPPRAKTAAKEGSEAEVPIPGVVLPRGDGFVSLAIEESHFRLRFYDRSRQQIPAPHPRATVRWNSPLKTGESRCILNPGPDGKTLAGNQYVRPPYVFKAFVTLLDAEGTAAESHVFDFKL